MPPLHFLATARLYLRPLDEADIPYLVRWINQPEMRNWLRVRTPNSVAAEHAWLQHVNSLGTPPAQILLGIVRKAGPRLIGAVDLQSIDWINRNASVGIYVGAGTDRRAGYGTEALLAVLGYAFETLDLMKINAQVNATNQASQKLITGCGFQPEGNCRELLCIAGKRVDLLQFGMTRTEWAHATHTRVQ